MFTLRPLSRCRACVAVLVLAGSSLALAGCSKSRGSSPPQASTEFTWDASQWDQRAWK